jgi:hypothetical protein
VCLTGYAAITCPDGLSRTTSRPITETPLCAIA